MSLSTMSTRFKFFQGWGPHHFPGQAVLMPDNPFCKGALPNAQSKVLLAQLETVSSCPVNLLLGNKQFGNRPSCHSALSKPTDCKTLNGLVQCQTSSSPSASQHPDTRTQRFCISHYLSCRTKSLSTHSRALWFSANFVSTTISWNSSSASTCVSQWSLLTDTDRDNIVMF